MKKLYMVVTADKYELPMMVADKVEDIAEFTERTKECVYSSVSRGNIDKKLNAKYARVEL